MAPSLAGTIRRRMLVNYRVDPAVMRTLVPEPFALRLVDGYAITGMCLIRLERMRPTFAPGDAGFASESVAYRTRVVGADGPAVFIARRTTASRLQAAAGGRLFPARFAHAQIEAVDDGNRLAIDVRPSAGESEVHVAAHEIDLLPGGSAFGELRAASDFFETGPVGWTCRPDGGFDGVELRTGPWRVRPLAVDDLAAAYFDDRARFPAGSIAFDSALVMREVAHEWHAVRSLARSA